MEATDISLKKLRNGTSRLGATIRSKLLRRAFRLRYVFDSRFADYVTPYGDPLLMALLPICSYHHEDLVVDAPVTRDLIRQVPKIVDKFMEFYPEFAEVRILADSIAETTRRQDDNRRAASFLSLGLDSLYTLFRNKDAIDLVIVNAFDQVEWEDSYLRMVVEGVRATLQKLNSPADILVVRSNIFQLSHELVEWGAHYHGACLASVANIFSLGIGRAFIAGSYSSGILRPWGSHPELDPLWSTSSMEIVHDSAIRRLDKTIELAEQPDLFEHLRVCVHHFKSGFNCGWCPKCISTSMNLKTAGVLRYCRTLPHDIRVERVPYLVDMEHHTGWIDLDHWIDALGDDPDDAHLKAAFVEARLKWQDPSIGLFPVKTKEMTGLAAKGKFLECSNLADQLLEMDPYDPIVNYYKGLCLFWYHRKLPDAVTFFEKAHEFGYDEFLCLYHAGLTGIFSGDFRKGGSALLSARRLDSRRFAMRIIKDIVRFILIRTGLYPHLLHKYSTLRYSDAQDPKRGAQAGEIDHNHRSTDCISVPQKTLEPTAREH